MSYYVTSTHLFRSREADVDRAAVVVREDGGEFKDICVNIKIENRTYKDISRLNEVIDLLTEARDYILSISEDDDEDTDTTNVDGKSVANCSNSIMRKFVFDGVLPEDYTTEELALLWRGEFTHNE